MLWWRYWGAAVVATLAGASDYPGLGSVAADFPQQLLERLGARFDSGKGCPVAPRAGTLRRMLIAIGADELDRRVGGWLREHAGCDADGWAIALDGKDLNGSWDDHGRLVLFSAMTHSSDDQAAMVIGQIAVPERTTETNQVKNLLDGLDIAGALVTAAAAHTCAETARYLVEDKNADYLHHRTRPRPDQPLVDLDHPRRSAPECTLPVPDSPTKIIPMWVLGLM